MELLIKKNPFEFNFSNNYDTKKLMFLKDTHKHVFKVFEKNIQFKNNRYIAKLPVRKNR